ncbi:MAG: type II secretion system protein GspC [Polyangiaceae bacterium]
MRFERILRKNFWAVWLLLLAGGAFFTARAFSQGLGIVLAADEKQLGAAPLVVQKSAAKSGSTHVTDGSGILARNPFDHTTGPLHDEPVEDPTSSGPVVDNNADPMSDPACDGVTILAIVASADPDWSFAVFWPAGESKSVLRRRGQEVGGKQVHYVRWDRVWMMNGHTRCQAKLFKQGGAPAAAPEPVAATPPPKGGAPSASAELAKGIQKIGPGQYNIDRGTVDKILENQAELMKMARIVPEKEGDKIVGIRLFGVRPDTMLGLIGLENGDRLQTINGFDIANPEKALEAYARLRSAEKLTVQVNRGGKNINLDYNVR